MKTAILTGPSSGIGNAIAEKLTSEGWQIVGLVHNTKAHAELAKTYTVDLSDMQATAKLGKQLAKDLPHVDAFIHTAGIWHDENESLAGKQLDKFTPEQIAASINVGVTSAMVLCNALLANIANGTVIGVSGTFSDGGAGWLPYYVSKRALEDFLVGLSQDYPDVKVFGISPADTATPAYQKFYPQYAAEAQSPEAVANLAAKLLGGQTEFKSGDVIEVRDGDAKEGYHA
jgi:NAD(P)-dependent dehydrogenase (short-subunit alcohol dehydrogenase family)